MSTSPIHPAPARDNGHDTRVQLLTPEQVSELTGLSIETLAQWRFRKRHLAYLKIGRRIRYDPNDIDQYLARCRVSVSCERRQK